MSAIPAAPPSRSSLLVLTTGTKTGLKPRNRIPALYTFETSTLSLEMLVFAGLAGVVVLVILEIETWIRRRL